MLNPILHHPMKPGPKDIGPVTRQSTLRSQFMARIEREDFVAATGVPVGDDGHMLLRGRVIHMPLAVSPLPVDERSELAVKLDELIEQGFTTDDIRASLAILATFLPAALIADIRLACDYVDAANEGDIA